MRPALYASLLVAALSGATPAVQSIEDTRELVAAPNGDLFVGTAGQDVYILPHADAAGPAGEPRVFAHFDDSLATGVAFAGDALYVGTQFATLAHPHIFLADDMTGAIYDPIEVSGEYECSECGYRQKLAKGGAFPPDHHADKPWTLYLASEQLPAQQTET